MTIEGQAEVEHLVRNAQLSVEDIVNGLCTAPAIGYFAAVQRRVVVRRITLVVGHDVDVVHIGQHAHIVGVLAVVAGRIGKNLVGHGLTHLSKQGHKVLPVGGRSPVHVVSVLGGIGRILPVYVKAVYTVVLADLDALGHKSGALVLVAGHLRPAVGIPSPAAHLQLHLELRILGLVGYELLYQRNGLGVNLHPHAVVLVTETHVSHVDVREIAHLLDGREQRLLGVLRVIDFDDGSLADTRQALGIVDDLIHGIVGVIGSGRIGVVGIERIPTRNLAT